MNYYRVFRVSDRSEKRKTKVKKEIVSKVFLIEVQIFKKEDELHLKTKKSQSMTS